MNDLRVSIIQTELVWENPLANLEVLEQKILLLENATDVIVLPEMFSTGFSMNTKFAASMDGSTLKWMQIMARRTNAVVTGSLMVKENEQFYNRLIWMQPDGVSFFYDKKHLFSLTDEPKIFSEGNKRLIVEWKNWKICPLICYDLRFPVWSRNQGDYDLLIYVANFPERRRYAWKQLLIARAIENQSYTIGVNIVGKDGNGIDYSGDSVILNPKGEILEESSYQEAIITTIISKTELERVRSKYPFLADRDEFVLTNKNI